MKKLYILFIFTLLRVTSPAQMSDQADVFQPTPAVNTKFTTEYPGITPTWKAEGENFNAEFVDTVTFKGTSILYTPQGKILRRESEMENSTYPQNINTYYVKKYPGEKFKTWRSIDDRGVHSYCIKRTSETIWFDNNGNYIDPEKKSEETAAASR